LSIRKRAIAALILYSAPIWLQNGASQSRDGASLIFGASIAAERVKTDRKLMVAIEVDAFSGRPNPVTELRDAEAEKLAELLERTRDRFSDEKIATTGLGFRGFVVRIGQKVYRVVGSVVIVDGRHFSDPGRSAERYIISVLPANLRALVEQIKDGADR
jgi:hypothetical protein